VGWSEVWKAAGPYRNSDLGVGFPEFLAQTFGQGVHGMFSGGVEMQWPVGVYSVCQGAVAKQHRALTIESHVLSRTSSLCTRYNQKFPD
jgi:hypothetical protein